MSLLTLVRHGQASYMSEDYDKLSSLGERQSHKLAEFWIRHSLTFTHVYCGPARRHAQTLEIISQVHAAAGVPFPEPEILANLDEFDAFTMMRVMTPLLAGRYESVRQLNEDFRSNRDSPEAGRILQKLFEEIARLWCSGEFDAPDVEPWAQFRRRVESAICHIRANTPPSSSAVAITSGGPIAAAVGFAFGLNPAHAVELLWQSRNTSWSEFLFSGERFSLASFNSIHHLDSRDLVTYR